MRYRLLLVTLLLFSAVLPASAARGPITFASLLREMTDRASLAEFPEPFYTVRQFSSYDRASDKAEKGSYDWFANWDFSQFLRTEHRDGRREFVMFDADGPGAVVRIWVTVANYNDNGILRFYLDGSETPAIEGEVLSLISGHALVGPPLSTSVSPLTPYKQRGHDLYLPIPYGRHCKITYETPGIIEAGRRPPGENFFYSVGYRTYVPGTKVKTFEMADLSRNAGAVRTAQNALLARPELDGRYRVSAPGSRVIARGGDGHRIELKGAGAVRAIRVRLSAGDPAQALRSTILKISFDDNPTVWAPVGDFFGTGNRLSPYRSFYTTVERDSVLTCYWVMPYRETCTVELENLGGEPVVSSLAVYSSPWRWSDRSMYFGAGWTEYHGKYTGPHKSINGTSDAEDINFVTLTGKGIYVGDAVTVFNTVGDWWGEGDEKVYIDGEDFPSHFGTGTEDYYGYAWCLPNFFDHPFIAQPDGTGAYQVGHVANLRYRGLDGITFERSLVFDMEFWHQSATRINYAPTAYWYMLPGGAANRGAEAALAALPVAKRKNDLVSNRPDGYGRIEGEFMRATVTGGMERTQCIPEIGWSNGVQFLWREAQTGDRLRLGFVVDEEGDYRMQGNFTIAPDYGRFSVGINGRELLPVLDTYGPELATRTVDLGVVRLQRGENELEIRLLPKNERAVNALVGLDYLTVTRAAE
ncbi:MAG: DUF2961 domain-containing protein [Rikenellaceae bacterium]|nr:DUF2961 domain-containing protein [Rikenellaceae bacterium]